MGKLFFKDGKSKLKFTIMSLEKRLRSYQAVRIEAITIFTEIFPIELDFWGIVDPGSYYCTKEITLNAELMKNRHLVADVEQNAVLKLGNVKLHGLTDLGKIPRIVLSMWPFSFGSCSWRSIIDEKKQVWEGNWCNLHFLASSACLSLLILFLIGLSFSLILKKKLKFRYSE